MLFLHVSFWVMHTGFTLVRPSPDALEGTARRGLNLIDYVDRMPVPRSSPTSDGGGTDRCARVRLVGIAGHFRSLRGVSTLFLGGRLVGNYVAFLRMNAPWRGDRCSQRTSRQASPGPTGACGSAPPGGEFFYSILY